MVAGRHEPLVVHCHAEWPIQEWAFGRYIQGPSALTENPDLL
jgi:hypothetical protein